MPGGLSVEPPHQISSAADGCAADDGADDRRPQPRKSVGYTHQYDSAERQRIGYTPAALAGALYGVGGAVAAAGAGGVLCVRCAVPKRSATTNPLCVVVAHQGLAPADVCAFGRVFLGSQALARMGDTEADSVADISGSPLVGGGAVIRSADTSRLGGFHDNDGDQQHPVRGCRGRRRGDSRAAHCSPIQRRKFRSGGGRRASSDGSSGNAERTSMRSGSPRDRGASTVCHGAEPTARKCCTDVGVAFLRGIAHLGRGAENIGAQVVDAQRAIGQLGQRHAMLCRNLCPLAHGGRADVAPPV